MAGEQEKTTKKLKKWHIIVIVIVVALIIAGAVGGKGNKNSDDGTESNQATSGELTRDDAENYCQDAGLIKKYTDTSGLTIINVGNYNPQYDKFDGWYDGDGYPIYYMRWNGKDRTAGTDFVRFDCWISGRSKDSIVLHRLDIGGEVVYDTIETTIFDENKDLVFANDNEE